MEATLFGQLELLPVSPAPRVPLRQAVEDELRRRGITYINIEEAKRALFSGARLAAFHFVVYHTGGTNWLVWAAHTRKQTREDMTQWQTIFGDGFVAVIARITADGRLAFRKLDDGSTLNLEQ